MTKNLPDWVQKAQYDAAEAKLMDNILSNWLRLQQYLAANNTSLDENHFLKLLHYEVTHKARHHVVERIYGKYSKMRRKKEREQLAYLATN